MPSTTDVLSYHNDPGRTGANLNETILTPANVNSTDFGKLFSYSVDGQVYAEPLYKSGVVIPGAGTFNVVFMATEHDSIYAFDADSNTSGPNGNGLLWSRSFINPSAGLNPVLSSDVGCGQIRRRSAFPTPRSSTRARTPSTLKPRRNRRSAAPRPTTRRCTP